MEQKKLPVVLNQKERETMLKQANKRYITGHRNRVMMQLMFNIGLRLAEVVDLEWRDVDFLSETLMVREGKGKKDRILYIKDNNWRGENDKTALQQWKEKQEKALDYTPNHVFTSMSEHAFGKKMGHRYVQRMIDRYAKKAGIQKKVGPHTLRHTFGTDLYRRTKDLAVVQRALGHSNISTTMVYVHLVNGDVEAALSGLAA